MIPTHATKAGVRYRYYVSTPFLHGEAKTASAGSVPRVPAADIEDTVVKCLREHLAARQDKSTTSRASARATGRAPGDYPPVVRSSMLPATPACFNSYRGVSFGSRPHSIRMFLKA